MTWGGPCHNTGEHHGHGNSDQDDFAHLTAPLTNAAVSCLSRHGITIKDRPKACGFRSSFDTARSSRGTGAMVGPEHLLLHFPHRPGNPHTIPAWQCPLVAKADIPVTLGNVRFWENSGHRDFGASCPLLTQSGHERHLAFKIHACTMCFVPVAYRATLCTGSIFAPQLRLTIPSESDSAWGELDRVGDPFRVEIHLWDASLSPRTRFKTNLKNSAKKTGGYVKLWLICPRLC